MIFMLIFLLFIYLGFMFCFTLNDKPFFILMLSFKLFLFLMLVMYFCLGFMSSSFLFCSIFILNTSFIFLIS